LERISTNRRSSPLDRVPPASSRYARPLTEEGLRNGSKPLPQDIDAEKAFLGAILLAPNRLLDEQADLQPSDFHHPAHKEIFTQFLAMRSADVPINAVALTGWLNDRHLLEKIGGNGEINDLINVVPTANGADYYAQRIRKKALARNMVSFGQRVIADANDPAQQENLLTKVQEELTIIAAGGKSEARSLPPMISARDLCSKPPPTPPEIIEGILHQGSKMALGGGSKSFKTWTLLELSICVATGRDWLGFPTAKGGVLYVNFELPAFAIEKRIREICGAMFVDVPENLIVWNLRGHAASAATILPMISQKAKAAGFTLIILDPLYKLLGERDENTSRDMTNLMNHVERLAVDTGAAVAFGSHYSKGNQSGKESMDRIRGSGVAFQKMTPPALPTAEEL
jgi:AAA domain/DnaB-like helicase N terminal domain